MKQSDTLQLEREQQMNKQDLAEKIKECESRSIFKIGTRVGMKATTGWVYGKVASHALFTNPFSLNEVIVVLENPTPTGALAITVDQSYLEEVKVNDANQVS
jgi:hypothetical protein